MKMLRAITAAVMLISLIAPRPAPVMAGAAKEGGGPYTLERCLEMARRNSAVLAAAGEEVEAAGAAVRSASSSRLPSVSAGADYAWTSEVMEHRIGIPGLGGMDLKFGDGHQADLNLGISMPIYTGGRLGKMVEAEKAGLAAKRYDREAAGKRLEHDLRRAFYDVLGRKARLEVIDLKIASLERHLEDIRAAIGQGSAAQEDALRVRSKLLEAGQSRQAASAALRAGALELGRLVGEPGREIAPEGDLERPLLPEQDSGWIDSKASSGRPELSALEERGRRQALLADAAGRRYLPDLVGDIRGHYGRPGVDLLENDWMGYGTARVALSWSIWDAGKAGEDRDMLRASARAIESRREEMARAFRTAWASAAAMVESIRLELADARQRVEIEKEIMKKTESRFRLAQASENDFLDSQDELTEARLGLEMTLTRLRMAEADLIWTLGR